MVIIASTLIRGSYHLYQGFGGFAGNLIMGVLFGLIYLKWKRVMPMASAPRVEPTCSRSATWRRQDGAAATSTG